MNILNHDTQKRYSIIAINEDVNFETAKHQATTLTEGTEHTSLYQTSKRRCRKPQTGRVTGNRNKKCIQENCDGPDSLTYEVSQDEVSKLVFHWTNHAFVLTVGCIMLE